MLHVPRLNKRWLAGALLLAAAAGAQAQSLAGVIASIQDTIEQVLGWPAAPPSIGRVDARLGFAPYLDVTLSNAANLADLASQLGIQRYTLAFINDSGNCNASFGGYAHLDLNSGFSNDLSAQVAALRQQGGDVMMSFGGSIGPELALNCASASELKAQYASVIRSFGLKKVDFDLEGSTLTDRAATLRRAQALQQLQQEQPDLQVWLTLPTLPSGLSEDGLYTLRTTLEAGVQLTGVNLLAMDYGEAAEADPSKLDVYAQQAATALVKTLKSLLPHKRRAELWRMVGITPMIGENTSTDEVFTLEHAASLSNWARRKDIGMIGIWSIARDMPCPDGATGLSPTCSSIAQSPYAFSNIFKALTPLS